ncbi:Vesicle transport protein GOT1A [Paramecium bursaria]
MNIKSIEQVHNDQVYYTCEKGNNQIMPFNEMLDRAPMILAIYLESIFKFPIRDQDRLRQQKPLEIGIGFLLASFGAFFLGILFVFDRSLILMGNLSFFIGLIMLIGVKSTYGFFLKQGNKKGSLVFFLGFIIIIMRFTIIGLFIQLYGLYLLFRSFLPFVYDSASKMPIIGRYLRNPQIKHAVDNLSQKNKGPTV